MKSKIILGLLLVTSNGLLAAPQYAITPLGTLGGDESYANDINDQGKIVGQSKTSQGIKHAFISSIVNGTRVITDIGSSEEGESGANAINNNGQVAGYSGVKYQEGHPYYPDRLYNHATLFEKIANHWVVTDLHPDKFYRWDNDEKLNKSNAVDINDSAQMVITRDDPYEVSSIELGIVFAYKHNNSTSWSYSTVEEAFEANDQRRGYSATINNSAQVAFSFRPSSRDTIMGPHAVGTIVSYSDIAWKHENIVSSLEIIDMKIYGMNDSNQVTGSIELGFGSSPQPFIATKNESGWVRTELGHLGSNTLDRTYQAHGTDINDSGVAVGYIDRGFSINNSSSFVYTDGKMHDLMDLIGSGRNGWTQLSKAKAINNSGKIVGSGVYNGKNMAYLLTPIPESTASCSIGVDPITIKIGEGFALWWWTDDALTANINPNIGDVGLPSNYQWLTPTETTTYTLYVTGNNGLITHCKAKVNVTGICELGADPQVITRGEGTALWWWTDNISLERGAIIHDVGRIYNGSETYRWVKPEQTTTYKMTAKTADGAPTSCETTVIVE